MKNHFLGNKEQWIVESSYDNFEEFSWLFYRKEFPDRQEVSDKTSTYRGLQYNVHPKQIKNYDYLTNHIQSVLDELNVPIKITELCASWIIEYKKGGWQKMHRHGDGSVNKLSVVIYMDNGEDIHGATFACLYDGNGYTHDLCYPYKAGDMLIFDSKVLHGAYPTKTMKRVFVADFFYEEK